MDMEQKSRQLMEQEGIILQKLSHPNIIKCYETKIIYIIIKYAHDIDL